MKFSGHNLLFRLKCADSKDSAFQKFFERIMQKHDKTFVPVMPAGPEGDWKCDGYSVSTKTVYQCYSPYELRSGKTSRKIREDFKGAQSKWGAKMERWVFVWNADALPPQVVAVLAEIENENEAQTTIDQLGPHKLWEEVVSGFSKTDLDELLGEVPTSSDLPASQLRLAGKALRRHDVDLAKDLCQEVLASTGNNEALGLQHFEACNLMTIVALQEKDLKRAWGHLEQAAKHLGQNIQPVLQAQYYQLEGILFLRENRNSEAEAAFMKGLDVRPSATSSDMGKGVPVEELQCAIRAHLIMYFAQTNQAQIALVHAETAEAYVRNNPKAQDGNLLPDVVDALITFTAVPRAGHGSP